MTKISEKKERTPTLILHKAQVDYLTLTSFSPTAWQGLDKMISDFLGVRWTESRQETTRQQYVGYAARAAPLGYVFLGSGEQQGRSHVMMHLTGRLSHVLFFRDYVRTLVQSGEAAITRLDVQMTVPQPKRWSQWDTLIRLKADGIRAFLIPSWDRAVNQELSTIYIGSRHSMRFRRLYQKVTTENDICLRFEVELKKARAHQTGSAILSDKAKIDNYLAYEIKTTRDPAILQAFGGELDYDAAITERIKAARPFDGTYEWIIGVCLPVIDRYLQQHDSASEFLRHQLEMMLSNGEEQ